MNRVRVVMKWLLVLVATYYGSIAVAVLITPSGDPYSCLLVFITGGVKIEMQRGGKLV